ncbi:MAG: PQQ-dependent sugar dehydrogenase [Acidobacteria bacterium]|nr:PQQ-dependent sugar dehydrogenase [Acidobacteriota bacterium]
MKGRTVVVAAVAVTMLWAARPTISQVADPIPAPIPKRGLRVEIRDVARLPDTRNLRPGSEDTAPGAWARVSFVRDLPDGRRFANDSRGRLYLLAGDGRPALYLDLAAEFPLGFYRSLESGFIAFTFHPDFARNGLIYTVHGEKVQGNPGVPHFIPPGFTRSEITYQTVITEWHATAPAANAFKGTHREMLRVAHVVDNYFHPIGALEFNPTSRPGSPDYGLLYIGSTDFGFSNGGGPRASNPAQTQRLDSIVGAILRIDPRSPSASGGVKGIGDYTIPPVNKFAADGDPKTLGEIYAYGFRNPHRLSWDLADGTLFASDIGMSQVEEINIVREGGNYGWMKREGIFENGVQRPGGVLGQVFPLPANILDGSVKDGFTYPVAMYDHGEGVSITGGFVYGGRIPALRGKFVFGDINRGRVFAADVAALKKADDGIPATVAPIEEIELLVRQPGGPAAAMTFKALVEKTMGGQLARADLHIHRAADGELLLSSRQDGWIRTLAAAEATTRTSAER